MSFELIPSDPTKMQALQVFLIQVVTPRDEVIRWQGPAVPYLLSCNSWSELL